LIAGEHIDNWRSKNLFLVSVIPGQIPGAIPGQFPGKIDVTPCNSGAKLSYEGRKRLLLVGELSIGNACHISDL